MEKNILFIHGAGGSSQLWTRQKKAIPPSLTPDLVGHPQGLGREYIEDYASWLNEYRLQKGLSQIYLVGHSMGGAIALQMARFFPYAVKGLALLSTGAALKVSPALFTQLAEDPEEGIAFIIEHAFHPQAPARLKEKSLLQMQKIHPQVIYGDFLACHRFDIREEVGEIQIPTLILVGEEDRMTPVKYSQFLNQKMPQASLEIIPGAGHMLMLEKYQEVNSLLKNFFSQCLKVY